MIENSKLENIKDIVRLSVSNKPEYVSVVRLTASAVASRMGFNIEEIEDIKVAIAEVCTNAIQYSEKENEIIDIKFYIYSDRLCIAVKNPGRGLCGKNLDDCDELESKENELRLFIIKSLMDDVSYRKNEKESELIMIKKIGVK
jgi:serine/threonine-protein kinase RsbW